MSGNLEVLRRLRVLEGLDDEHLTLLAAVAEEVSYPAGAVIFREGELARDIYLIVDGSVSLEVCGASVGCRRILTVTEGELLGWSPVLEQTRLSATARALEPTRAVRLSGKQVLTLCEHDARFGYEFMRRAALALANRLNATRLQLLNVYGHAMPTTDER
ncbi:MAG: cyclic nucleotide-binding domain-containing protein [Pirellulaceae bacterium]